MPSRQDQLHSYQFMVQRVVAALVMRDTDPAQSPFRRVAGSTLVGVLLAALALGGVAAYGLVVPGGSDRWKDPGAIIVEKESGALYAYRTGRLHPVLNYTSALLIVGSPGARTVFVARRSMRGVPRGATLGISGAPDSLPGRGELRSGSWTICSRGTGEPAGGGGTAGVESVLFVAGAGGTGGRALAERDDAPAMLVRTPDGARYVIWKHHRHLIRNPAVVLPRLVWTDPPLPVATAFLNALPAGADLAVPVLPGRRGARVKRPAGGRVGQVYVVAGADGVKNYFVAVPDGLASLTPLQKELLLADPQAAGVVGRQDATVLGRAEFARLGRSVRPLVPAAGAGALPVEVPRLAKASGTTICAAVKPRVGITEVRLDPAVVDTSGAVAVGAARRPGVPPADRIVVPPGSGVLVAADPAVGSGTSLGAAAAGGTGVGGGTGSGSGTVSLVTDLGLRHAVPGDEVLAILGYAGQRPVRLPAEIVSLLPSGRALDPRAARTPAVAG